jgi:prepilin-type N-terminal cleavage/methylation domain-containing protein
VTIILGSCGSGEEAGLSTKKQQPVGHAYGRRARGLANAGYSMIELMTVVAIMGIMTGIAATIMDNVIPGVHADSSLDLVVAQLRQAREMAIDQRRNFIVTFQGTRELVVVRQELGGTQTPISDLFLSSGVTYMLTPGAPDTPDGFGNTQAVNFAGGNEVIFVSDGTVTNPSGLLVNGSAFMGITNTPASARAVTIMGATGRIKGYSYSGTSWF